MFSIEVGFEADFGKEGGGEIFPFKFLISVYHIITSVSWSIWSLSSLTSLFKEAMSSPLCDKLYITEVLGEFPCDTFFPPVDTTVYKPVDLE